jgi:hypothetical protein
MQARQNLTAQLAQSQKEKGVVEAALDEYDGVMDEVLSGVRSAAVDVVCQQIVPTFAASRKHLDKQVEHELAVNILQELDTSFKLTKNRCAPKVLRWCQSIQTGVLTWIGQKCMEKCVWHD